MDHIIWSISYEPSYGILYGRDAILATWWSKHDFIGFWPLAPPTYKPPTILCNESSFPGNLAGYIIRYFDWSKFKNKKLPFLTLSSLSSIRKVKNYNHNDI
jgi:hypothetical protein